MYTEYYSLTTRPFENTPDPQFVFMSKEHREVLATLIYGIRYAKGFILVTGDIGTGKTTLIHVLLKELDPSSIILNVKNPRSTFSDLVAYLAKKLALSTKGKDSLELIEVVQKKLESLDEAGRRVGLIIDEAHLLSKESLENIRLLSNIENEKRKLIQIILVGQNEIHDKLRCDSLKPLRQRMVFIRNLKPLDRNDTLNYIKHRLQVAGRNSELFSKSALLRVWRKSRGIPRIINQICDNALLIGFAIGKSTIGHKIIKEVIKDMEADGRRHQRKNNYFLREFNWVQGGGAIAILMIVCLTAFFVAPKPIAEMKQKLLSGSRKDKQITDEERFHSVDPKILLKTNNSIITNTKQSGVKTDQTLAESTSELNPNRRTDDFLKKRVELNRPLLSMPKSEGRRLGQKPNSRNKKVNPQEYLSIIALKEYGIINDTIIDLIHMANPDIDDVNTIFSGQQIALPQIEKKDMLVKDQNGHFHIHYASFYNYEEALQSVQEYIQKKEKIFIIPSRQGNLLVYRVYYGIYQKRDQAMKSLHKLKLKYLSFLSNKEMAHRNYAYSYSKYSKTIKEN